METIGSKISRIRKQKGMTQEELSELAKKAFKALGGKSLGRIDIKMNHQGVPHFMEANLMPGLRKGYFYRSCLLNLDMNYDDMIIRNQVGIGINEDPYAAKGDSMYNFFSQRAVASILNRKSIPYLDRSYLDKRRILREYSIKDEIRDFISSLADESIVYNDERDFCSPKPLSNDYSQEIKDKYQEYFEKIYNKFGFFIFISVKSDLLDTSIYFACVIFDYEAT